MINKRVFVSFDEPCVYKCKHCYTYGIPRNTYRSIDEIVDSISNKDFDVIYVSQKNDNFSNPDRGLTLCEKLFYRYKKDIFIITRSIIQGDDLRRMNALKEQMNILGKHLFIAISLNSINPDCSSENIELVASPAQRAAFMRELSLCGYHPILMLRPVFPDHIIPIEDCIEAIRLCSPHFSCIVSSGLGVNEEILKQLSLSADDLKYSEDQTYLQGAIDCDIKFVDVERELTQIKSFCKDNQYAFFEHSIPAINYITKESA